MYRYENMQFPIDIIPKEIIEEYGLMAKVKNGFTMCEIWQGIHGLHQVGILANKILKKRISEDSYRPCKLILGLWKHYARQIKAFLTVDDFGIKYARKPCRAFDWGLEKYCTFLIDFLFRT